jgi:hypothetical protein
MIERLQRFFFLLLIVAVFYALDCAIAFGTPQNVSWLESGIYAGPSFLVTVCLAGGSFYYLIFGKDKH